MLLASVLSVKDEVEAEKKDLEQKVGAATDDGLESCPAAERRRGKWCLGG